MKGERVAKTSTDYQREYRDRMRQLGLVKKDVWIRPEHATDLAAIEKRMREAGAQGSLQVESAPAPVRWTLTSLHDALLETEPFRDGSIALERIEGAEPSLHLTMRDYGDLPVFVAVGGEQIVVEALLWPVEHVADPVAFNAHVLQTHKILPLTTLGIERVGETAWYIMSGALDTRSGLPSVLFEIETLADNVIGAVEAYLPFLRPDARSAA